MSSPQVSEQARSEVEARSSRPIETRFSLSFEAPPSSAPSSGILECELESATHASRSTPLDRPRSVSPVSDEAWCSPGVRRA